MLKWKIVYEDGSTFSNKDGNYKDAPFWGVMGVACDSDEWRAVDYNGLLDYLQQLGIVKLGRETSNPIYHETLTNLRSDSEMSPDRVIQEGKDFYIWMGALDGD